jgi:hypothetical protein
MKWVATVLFLVVGAQAQTKSCPADVVRVVPSYVNHTVGCWTIRQCDAVEIVNNSDKKIIGAKFHMVYYDAVGDSKDNGIDYMGDNKVKAGKKSLYVWRTRFLVEDRSQGASASLSKVLFEDGSTWEDSGRNECSGRSK